jgi:hypothetical protein
MVERGRSVGQSRPLLREATAGEECIKAGIGSVRIPFRIDRQIHQVHVTRGVGFVEPLEHRLTLTQAGMHERHRKRWYVALAGVGFQLLQHFARFVGPPVFARM